MFRTNETSYRYPLSKRISHFLLQHAHETEELGLCGGKAGLALYFFRLSRHTGVRMYEHFAGTLIDDIVDSICADTPVDFENGLAGIGWMMEHLLKAGFIDGNRDEILEEFDQKIATEYMKESFDTRHWIGYGLYFHRRLNDRSGKSAVAVPLLEQQMTNIMSKLDKCTIERYFSGYTFIPPFSVASEEAKWSDRLLFFASFDRDRRPTPIVRQLKEELEYSPQWHELLDVSYSGTLPKTQQMEHFVQMLLWGLSLYTDHKTTESFISANDMKKNATLFTR